MSLKSSVSAAPLRKRLFLSVVSILLATAIWMPLLHFVFRPGREQFRSEAGVSPVACKLAQRHLDLWAAAPDAQPDIARMRVTNPEWDFMGRTFLVLALANMSLHEPAQQQAHLAAIDRIIDQTDAMVRRNGITHFLMDYATASDFRQQPVRSIFVDGELALMMGARRMVAEHEGYAMRMRELVDLTAERMAKAPARSCESYPDECWTFCNTVALAAMRMHEVLDGEDHSQLRREWLACARKKLVHARTGLLCSSYSWEALPADGPEGSSIWLAAHMLQLLDQDFAADQYARARRELGRESLGFGWAAEWPESWVGPMDVDSGPVIPVIDVSAGSSGLAFVGAAAFGDETSYRKLATTLMFAGFPHQRGGRMQFCASNQVGDAVLLYSTVGGPLWKKILARAQAEVGS